MGSLKKIIRIASVSLCRHSHVVEDQQTNLRPVIFNVFFPRLVNYVIRILVVGVHT